MVGDIVNPHGDFAICDPVRVVAHDQGVGPTTLRGRGAGGERRLPEEAGVLLQRRDHAGIVKGGQRRVVCPVDQVRSQAFQSKEQVAICPFASSEAILPLGSKCGGSNKQVVHGPAHRGQGHIRRCQEVLVEVHYQCVGIVGQCPQLTTLLHRPEELRVKVSEIQIGVSTQQRVEADEFRLRPLRDLSPRGKAVGGPRQLSQIARRWHDLDPDAGFLVPERGRERAVDAMVSSGRRGEPDDCLPCWGCGLHRGDRPRRDGWRLCQIGLHVQRPLLGIGEGLLQGGVVGKHGGDRAPQWPGKRIVSRRVVQSILIDRPGIFIELPPPGKLLADRAAAGQRAGQQWFMVRACVADPTPGGLRMGCAGAGEKAI